MGSTITAALVTCPLLPYATFVHLLCMVHSVFEVFSNSATYRVNIYPHEAPHTHKSHMQARTCSAGSIHKGSGLFLKAAYAD